MAKMDMEQTFFKALRLIDPILIGFFRVTGYPLVDFFTGVFCLCMTCVVLGELTISAAIRLNRKHLQDLKQEVSYKEKLSFQAYAADDRVSYKALNKAANDAWGRYFFTMAAYSAGILWPVPFALGWMQTRFQNVDFELAFPLNLVIGDQVGYPFIFIPMYILTRIIFKYLRPRLPYFRGVQKMLDHPQKP
jgi:hypothetical protein